MPEQKDCLICFRKIKAKWIPPLTCECRPQIHRVCWEAWTDHIGYQTCVICRFPEPPPPPQPAAALILFEAMPGPQAQQPPRRFLQRLEDIATVVGVFFLIWMVLIMSAPQRVNIYLPPPSLQQPAWMRDEL